MVYFIFFGILYSEFGQKITIFLDATFRFIPNKIFDFNFYAKNILNKKVFSQVETTDFSTTIFQSNLIQRYYMLSVSYNF